MAVQGICGARDLDLLFGNLGHDFVDGFRSFTLDSVKMTFGVET
jgi:hypothetical protein